MPILLRQRRLTHHQAEEDRRKERVDQQFGIKVGRELSCGLVPLHVRSGQGATEELSDAEHEHIIAINLVGSIQLIRAALPLLRAQGGGQIIQISSYGGQVAFAGNSLYHATTWGIESFVESVAQEVAPFGIGLTIVEPSGARREFRYGSAQVATSLPDYDDTPAHAFQKMLDPKNGLAPGDPARMAARIIESVDQEPAPLHMVLGSQALEGILTTFRKRIADFETQTSLATSTDFPADE